ncbi:MAG: hypothetical protein EBU90_05490 [Proteobacteria bacterium]|nr:hypothetical protein [Pseudomonadota bacterium]NBP13636.1 hypothetical protein [bacterium]
MKKEIQAVQEWCAITEVNTSSTPRVLDKNRAYLRFLLMKEENEEYMEAASKEDPVEIADALGDMLYILLGTAIEHGMQDYLADVFHEIHRSNMSKMDENGKPILREDGKILKGPNYFRPNIKQILYEREKGKYSDSRPEDQGEERGY